MKKQVGLVRERFFSPRLRLKSYEELNAWLLDQIVAHARADCHSELDVGCFDKFHSSSGLGVRDLPRAFLGRWIFGLGICNWAPGRRPRPCLSIELRPGGKIVGEHPRHFGRDQTVFDPWHYVPVLARKPGALHNGGPFKDWLLPSAMERIRRKLRGAPRTLGQQR